MSRSREIGSAGEAEVRVGGRTGEQERGCSVEFGGVRWSSLECGRVEAGEETHGGSRRVEETRRVEEKPDETNTKHLIR